jgi:phosphoglycerate dehydrogenase-like enzyme
LNILVSIYSPVVMWNIPTGHVDQLRRAFPAHTFVHASTDDEALGFYPTADVAFTGHVTRDQLSAAPRLQWIHSPAAGVGGMLYPEMVARPIVMTNSRGMSSGTIAEHALAVTLAMFRRLPMAFRSQASREWAQDAISLERHRLVAGSRVLVVGLGAIGGAVADRFALLGARVTGIRRTPTASAPEIGDIAGPDRLLELLPHADVVVITAPHTDATRNLIGASELQAMKPDAIVVNVSRGQLIDEAALVDALRAGAIGGAALDVFVDEPLPPDSPFWTLPNVLITPHTAGFRPDHWDAAAALFAENLRRWDAGEPLMNVVDKVAGY